MCLTDREWHLSIILTIATNNDKLGTLTTHIHLPDSIRRKQNNVYSDRKNGAVYLLKGKSLKNIKQNLVQSRITMTFSIINYYF